MKIKSQKDFYSGVLLAAVGVAFAIGSRNYSIGTGARMGPGYFPQLLGVILALLGLAVIFISMNAKREDGDKIGAWAWKPLVMIIVSNLAFGILLGGLPSIGLPSMGLIAAIVALTILSALAGHEFKLKEVLILSVILAIGSYGAFILLLKLQMPLWPAFITG